MRRTIVMLLTIAGCAPASAGYPAQGPARSTTLNEPPRPMTARAPTSVAIYAVKPPEESFVEVSQIADLGVNENEALERLKWSSAQIGCDGLILGSSRVESVEEGIVQQISLSGTCIMFKQDPGTWREPLPQQRPPTPKPKPQFSKSEKCIEARRRIVVTKDPHERAQLAGIVQRECYR